MAQTWTNVAKFVGLGWIGLAAAGLPERYAHLSAANTITRDVCVLGGGSSGTYSALRLRDLGKSVVVIERKDRLGGHTNTYLDPVTNTTLDYGVVVYPKIDIVTKYFGRFQIPLTEAILSPPGVVSQNVNFRTGQPIPDGPPENITNALLAYGEQAAKYTYLNAGFYLPDPVPADLLLPFGEFVTKYGVEAAVPLIAEYAQGFGNLLRQPTLYLIKYFDYALLQQIQTGFLTTARRDNSELYDRAQAELGADALLRTQVLAIDRDAPGCVKVVVQTPAGIKLIAATKLLISIPPKLENLRAFDLDARERSLFKQWRSSGYYTGLLRNTGIPANVTLNNNDPSNTDALPDLPGLYMLAQTGVPGLIDVKYGSVHALSDAQVQADTLATVARLRSTGVIPASTSSSSNSSGAAAAAPEFAAYDRHTPYELTVSAAAIQAGFYKKLYALQGYRSTFYTGAAFQRHASNSVWEFSEALLPRIVA
ncbi:MAG: hypothetical protein M1826_007340 [Phylliscum demangeonii]|nr:MAG: hypothetical protein M1826_007340 [Phylliscum demangeonii]